MSGRSRSLWAWLLGAGIATGGAAQPSPGSYQPPAMKFDKPLSLADAVRLTLENDPAIRLSGADADIKAGIAREISGQFDWTFSASGRYEHREEELRLSVQQSEQRNRDKIDELIPRTQSLVDSLEQAIRNLQNPNVVTAPSQSNLTSGVTNSEVLRELERLQLQMIVLSELINRTADPVLRQQLVGLQTEMLASSRTALEATFAEVRGLPDELRRTREALGDAPKDQVSNVGTLDFDLSRQLRSGIVLGLFATMTYQHQNFAGKASTNPQQGGQGVPDLYKGEVGANFTVPLMRGLGRDSVAAPETAARREHDAALLLARHQAEVSLLNTLLAYWDLRAAAEEVAVAERSVKLQADLLGLTRELIKAAERPRADEARSLAAHADALARLESSRRRAHEAGVNLARFMGVALEPGSAAPTAADEFPRPPEKILIEDAAIKALANSAVEQRRDRQASAAFAEAGRIFATGAAKDTRRRLDLEGSVWGNSIAESKFSELDRWVLRSFSGAVRFEMPLANDSLEGRRAQAEASARQREIDLADAERNIGLNVLRLSESLRLAAERLRLAEVAAGHYGQTIEDEQAKLKAGDSTLVDTILTEQQTTSARLALVLARQQYASLLAQLRYEVGLLAAATEPGAPAAALAAVPASLQGRP